jgi:hypothetical protein
MIVQERNWVTVEGLNCRYVSMGETRDFPGMMIKEEMPLLVTTDIRNPLHYYIPGVLYRKGGNVKEKGRGKIMVN